MSISQSYRDACPAFNLQFGDYKIKENDTMKKTYITTRNLGGSNDCGMSISWRKQKSGQHPRQQRHHLWRRRQQPGQGRWKPTMGWWGQRFRMGPVVRHCLKSLYTASKRITWRLCCFFMWNSYKTQLSQIERSVGVWEYRKQTWNVKLEKR